MAITSVIEKPHSGDLTDEYQRNYTRTFQVVCDQPDEGLISFFGAVGLPAIGDPYQDSQGTYDLLATCKKITPTQTDDLFFWDVVCEYDSVATDPDTVAESPLLKPVVVDWSTVEMSKVADKDIFGVPIRNTAGDKFGGGLEVSTIGVAVTITKNVASFNSSLALTYAGAVNSDTFLGFAPLKVRMIGVKATSKYEQGYAYWETQWQFLAKEDGWRPLLLNQGPRYLKDGVAGDFKSFEDIHGIASNGEGLLASDGNKLTTGGTPVFLEFILYPEYAFSVLGLV
jgi:hypothetical protein